MSPEERAHWREAAALMRAWQERDPEQRDAWLAQQARTPESDAILRRLLVAERTPHARLDALSLAPATGCRIGDWELLDEIGRGGMARVFRARRAGSDYEQYAAVKLLQHVLRDSDQQRRFQRERQILARLRHPGIAALIDGGVAQGGTPFLVLQLIDGERIDRYCDQLDLDLRARVELLLEVGAAVAYAHRQLVVHRDLKPGNVMVDRAGRAVLLDFGIARLIDDSQVAGDTVTRAFTPEYAAPEQIRGEATIATALDVYGLGALAHRLLTGQAPLREKDGEARLPSLLDGLAPGRAQALRGDLDAVLMRALAIAPERRYASVEALTADMQAWSSQRPVQARAPRLGYRVGKWLRRHRQATIAASLALVALIAGVTATLWQWQLARQQAERAERVLGFLDDALGELVPGTPSAAAQADRGAMLDRLVAQGRREFADDPVALSEVLHRLALQYDKIGAMKAAHATTAEALAALQRGLPEGDSRVALRTAEEALLAHRIGGYDAQEKERIETAFRRATAALESGATPRDLAQVLLFHSSFAADHSRRDEALKMLQRAETLAAAGEDATLREDIGSRVAQGLLDRGLHEQAAAHYQRWLERARAEHGERHESVGRALFGLAVATSNLGRRREAANTMQKAIALLDEVFPEGNQRLQNQMPLAVSVMDRAGDHEAALALAQRNLDNARAMYGERNVQTGTALATLGRMLLARGDVADAETCIRAALSIYLDAFGPESDFVAIARLYLGDALAAADRHEQARSERTQAADVVARVVGDDSLLHARVLSRLGSDQFHLGQREAALDSHRRAVASFERHRDRTGQLEQARLGLAETLLEAGDASAAAAEAVHVERALQADRESPPALRWHLALVQAEIACRGAAADCAERTRRLREAGATLPVAPIPARQRRAQALFSAQGGEGG